jgi:hypothetical protein
MPSLLPWKSQLDGADIWDTAAGATPKPTSATPKYRLLLLEATSS